MKTEEFAMRQISVTCGKFTVGRMRTSKGGASISIEYKPSDGAPPQRMELNTNGEYEQDARNLAEALEEIANNPCAIQAPPQGPLK